MFLHIVTAWEFWGGGGGVGAKVGYGGRDGQVTEIVPPMIEVLERMSHEVFLSRITLSRSSGQGEYLTGLSIAAIGLGTS